MANIKSQIKRNRQSEVARVRNKGARSALRTKIKSFVTSVENGDTAAAQESYPEVSRALDKAAAKGLIHKRNAANQKSRLAKKLASK